MFSEAKLRFLNEASLFGVEWPFYGVTRALQLGFYLITGKLLIHFQMPGRPWAAFAPVTYLHNTVAQQAWGYLNSMWDTWTSTSPTKATNSVIPNQCVHSVSFPALAGWQNPCHFRQSVLTHFKSAYPPLTHSKSPSSSDPCRPGRKFTFKCKRQPHGDEGTAWGRFQVTSFGLGLPIPEMDFWSKPLCFLIN